MSSPKSRYFIHLAYKGTHYHGWQRQPEQISVQEHVERAFEIYLKQKIEIVGCGRTDTGVHASQYYAHFDTSTTIDRQLIFGLNSIMDDEVVIYSIIQVDHEDHARFSAVERVYHYTLTLHKTPFYAETMSYVPGLSSTHLKRLNETADVIRQLKSYKSFCKTGSQVKHYRCDVRHCKWSLIDDHKLVFEIRADRFLRGMVRLIVGNSIRVAMGKIELDQLKKLALEELPIPHALSAPADGLFLTAITYPPALQSRLDAGV